MPNCIINMFVLGCVVLGPKSQVMLIKPGVSCNNFTHPMPGTFHMLPWAAGGKYKVTTTQYKISLFKLKADMLTCQFSKLMYEVMYPADHDSHFYQYIRIHGKPKQTLCAPKR